MCAPSPLLWFVCNPHPSFLSLFFWRGGRWFRHCSRLAGRWAGRVIPAAQKCLLFLFPLHLISASLLAPPPHPQSLSLSVVHTLPLTFFWREGIASSVFSVHSSLSLCAHRCAFSRSRVILVESSLYLAVTLEFFFDGELF